jgi:hypothetical protein
MYLNAPKCVSLLAIFGDTICYNQMKFKTATYPAKNKTILYGDTYESPDVITNSKILRSYP